MRISFRTKIFLALALTTLVTLGGTLAAVERAYASKVRELIDSQVKQGRSTFSQVEADSRRGLVRDGRLLAGSPRLQAAVQGGGKTLRDDVFWDFEYHGLESQFISIAGPDGKPMARAHWRPGAEWQAGTKPPLEFDKQMPADPPEGFLIRAMMRDDAPESIHGWLLDAGRLFQVSVFPMIEREEFLRGFVAVGREVDSKVAQGIHKLQAGEDQAGFLVGDDLVASSFDVPRRDLLRGRIGVADEIDLQIDGNPFHIVVTALHKPGDAQPIYTALFISLRSLVEFRDRMRVRMVWFALAALGLSLLLSVAISRGVSKPVQDLVVGTERVAHGDYAHRIEVRSRDELGDLAGAFNQMAADLATKEKVRGVLNKVVAKEVAEELLKGDLGLGGRLVRATLLFADLRNFTGMTQNMAPQAIVAMLNEYMTAMSHEILACKGIVDKYVGDEIIGVFGAPKSYGHDAFAAVEAAFRMRERLGPLNEERARRGEPPLAMGIGVHTGEVVAGCMGSQEHLNYTCIGEVVNLASRLCSNAKPGQILISEVTKQEAGDKIIAPPLDAIQVKGFRQPVPVFELTSVEIGETARRRKA